MKSRIFALLLALLMLCAAAALANDTELQAQLPGEWTLAADTDEAAPQRSAVLTLREDGGMSLLCTAQDGQYTVSGTWAFELVTEATEESGLQDRLTLLFTATEDPAYAGGEYRAECVYFAYAEAWVENDAMNTWLLLEAVEGSDPSPFEKISGEEGSAALSRVEGPNMRVVNCKNYVSLREARDTKSARLAKVPLGAAVLAFPQDGEENGFLRCVYHDEYGYILSEYLEPVD